MIKKISSLTLCFLFVLASISTYAQWTQKQSLPGVARTFATGFTVNNTIYVMGGYDGSLIYNDVWAYDTSTDNWTQKANFPGGTRSAATSFTIGNKAYVGTGTDGNNYLSDFWEYEPFSDTWTQKANFPGYEREEAVGFGIGNKGYMGTGQTFVVGPNSSFTTTYNDFYEYDPSTDTWLQKDSLPGAPRAYAVATVVGNKAYVGLGGNDDQTLSFTDFYEYDPATDNWTPKAAMGGGGRADAGIVSFGNNIYVLGGINFPNLFGFSSSRKYDVLTNTWVNGPNFNRGVIIAPIVQSANGLVFAGTGYTNAVVPRSDWWQFTSLVTTVEAVESEQAIVFPNPFNDLLNLELGNNSGECTIEIFDSAAKLIYKTTKNNGASETLAISTKSFSKGIYLLRIHNAVGELIYSKKLVRN